MEDIKLPSKSHFGQYQFLFLFYFTLNVRHHTGKELSILLGWQWNKDMWCCFSGVVEKSMDNVLLSCRAENWVHPSTKPGFLWTEDAQVLLLCQIRQLVVLLQAFFKEVNPSSITEFNATAYLQEKLKVTFGFYTLTQKLSSAWKSPQKISVSLSGVRIERGNEKWPFTSETIISLRVTINSWHARRPLR